jgi:hypothetical protein
MIQFNVRAELGNLQSRVQQAIDASQIQLDQEVLKDSNFFIPKDTGELERSSLRASNIGQGVLRWDTPYARRLYYNPQYTFSKDVNPNAQGLWFEAAKARYKRDWIRISQQTLNSRL